MKAAVLREVHKPLTVEEIELGSPQQNEVLVRIEASGVCHSDLHRIHGDFPSPLPMVMGHEGAGVVEELGPGVIGLEVGDHVVLSIGPYCNACEACGNGDFSLCQSTDEARRVGGLLDATSRMAKDGQPVSHQSFVSSFAEYAVVPETGAIPVRKDAPLDKVALVGCGVTTGVAAVFNDAQVKPGSSVVVYGSGGVGLNAIQASALSGAEIVVAVDLLENKLELAKEFGATHTVNASNDDPVARVKEITRGGANYSFEVIGIPEVALQALGSLAPGGQCYVLGVMPNQAVLSIPWWELMSGRQSLQFSGFGAARPRADIPRIVNLYMAGKLKLDELVSRTFPLEEINTAFDLLEKGEVARSVIYPHR